MNPIPTSIAFSWILVLLATESPAVDDNANGLSDVWEQRYKASALLMPDDDDGDGFSNLKESIAGTNPLDSTSKPNLASRFFQENHHEFQLSFSTLSGKYYKIEESNDLSTFTALNAGWWGDGNDRELTLSKHGASATLSPVRAEFWADVAPGSVSALTTSPSFPLSPDGVSYLATPEAPMFRAAGYGARVVMTIKAPESGAYHFYVSAGGPAELYFGSASPGVKIAEVLPGQTGLGTEEWLTHPNQKSAEIPLTAGERYNLELRYVTAVPSQHVRIAWSGPGLNDIEILDRDDLSQAFAAPAYQSAGSNYYHDYESSGQTGLIWPANSTLETGINGMTRNAERVSLVGDQGFPIMRITFPKVSTNLYATWLFNMSNAGTPHGLTGLFFGNTGTGNAQEGPRVNMEVLDSGASATVRGGASGGNTARIDVAFNQTFRVEIVATINPLGFQYTSPTGPKTVSEDRFDLYVSTVNGTLVGSATGLTFRDGNLVEGFGEVAVKLATNPNIAFDSWEATDGSIPGSGYLISNIPGIEKDTNFYRLAIADQDQDNDSISDWEELALAKFHPFLFFDSQTANGTPDATALTTLLAQSQGKPEISLFATDAAAFENNSPNTTPDHGEITITRSGTLEPLSVKLCVAPLTATGSTATVCDGSCCMLVGSAGDEEAESTDYALIDEDGNTITDTVEFAFGETSKVLTLTAIQDAINEYPETVNLAVKVSPDYDISTIQNGASIQLFDLPDHPDNTSVFTGTFSQDGRAVVSSTGSGFTTAILNGPRTKIYLWDEFSNLTSAQQDSHVHKSNPGNSPGDIIYAITETPGDNASDPLNGPLTRYLWDLTSSTGALPTAGGTATKQTIIDSLFGQNSETPLYLNVHTVNNPAGEIWAFLNLSDGSVSDPGDALAAAEPGSAGYPQLSGELLEVEVRRFLNQATFGATDENVAALLNKINTQRLTNPSYHRHQAFSEWIDDQMNPQVTPQTFLLDFAIASHFQHLKASGIYDPVRNPTNGTIPTPPIPTPWPSINRSNPIPEHWYLSANYPLTYTEENVLASGNGFNLNHFGPEDVLCADWQLKLNGRDQLRHKMGFALQQIVVTSDVDIFIRENSYGSANYRDMLNQHAFDHYRDVLGFVNWSPVMGHWLSSIKNQKAIDFNNDGVFDSYPDENLARENMQLFSIGLFDMWSDGTLKLNSEGLPSPTYNNADIQEFAKIITGQGVSYYAATSAVPTWGGSPFSPSNTNFSAGHTTRGLRSRTMIYPMKMFGSYHSGGPKTFAGTTIDNTSITDLTQMGVADVESAIDWLAGKPGDGQADFDMVHSHVSTPAFITKRLIQRFTTSNPSKGYLHRAATVFKNSEGDLGLTVKQILLDPEARNLNLNSSTFGMKKSPLEAYQQMVRTLGGHTYFPLVAPTAGESPYGSLPINFARPDLYLENFGYPAAQINAQERNVRFRNTYTKGTGTTGLQMDPAYQDTVFNFYLPEYAKGGTLSDAGLVTPELQLATEPDIIRNINYFQALLYTSNGQAGKYLGETENDQKALFGNPTGVADFDHLRLPLQALADSFYPGTAPAAVPGRTSESLADEALLDAIDKRLTNGLFKLRYPYNSADNDDPATNGVDDLLKNPRELIIEAITDGYSNANDGSNDSSDRLNKFRDALYLLTLSSEYQIRK